MFKNAIVKGPCPEMVNGITTAGLGKPDYDLAHKQHQAYIEALTECGLEVTVLEADNAFPDSTFIEDAALCTPHCAIVMRPGADSRRGETVGLEEILAKFYNKVEKITGPGTVDAGDVMMCGSHYYIGRSDRTNEAGANQLIRLLEKYGLSGSQVEMNNLLHLKSGCSYLEENTMLASEELFDNPAFERINKIRVEKEETYASNSVWINGTVLTPKNYPLTSRQISQAGYKVIELDVSEFRKLDGGLSCLSLRF